MRLDRSTDVPIQANLFYVDPTNVLQEVISTDNFQTWQTGTLGLVYSNSIIKYINYIKKVLDKLLKVDLFLNINKYNFYIREVKYLSLIITINRLKIELKKLK